MLIDFAKVVKRYGLPVKGAIVVGAHTAEEHEVYVSLGIDNIIYIEPCEKAFSVLHERFWKQADRITLIKAACADYVGKANMYIETANTGMSNSILEPKDHLKYYPGIAFPDTEEVDVITLDCIDKDFHIFNTLIFNTLIMDCQGAEGLILKGANETLKHIEVIYTEVNTGNLYDGCMQLPEMDSFLKDRGFIRIETKLTNSHWGDAVFVRQSILNHTA